MNTEFDITETLDVTGENCPMPVIKTKQTTDGLAEGDVLEVVATDSGSMSDLKGWANTTEGVELLDQEESDNGGEAVYRHYVRKTE
ncbi:sulfurtransferase TusA family protein [Haladaptatus caseinilyticus]|uniref:sulfurtransferase TusA family protein n=1 Tax=Haladaptatus caseinilyticus TaxID=2993314 RepID=UPI00224B8AED|nr:sulfurtransferase TusA family protein [Haladaptatus caseinilyticus]